MGSRIAEALGNGTGTAPVPPERSHVAPEGAYAGIVAEDAFSMNQEVHVIVDNRGPVRHGAPARWMPRNDVQVMPKRGDRCLIAIDQHQEPWILVWWPSTPEVSDAPFGRQFAMALILGWPFASSEPLSLLLGD